MGYIHRAFWFQSLCPTRFAISNAAKQYLILQHHIAGFLKGILMNDHSLLKNEHPNNVHWWKWGISESDPPQRAVLELEV